MFAVQASLTAGQLAGEVREPDAATLRQVVTGRVCMPDGSIAVGATAVGVTAGGVTVN